jgi:hypothetical protein
MYYVGSLKWHMAQNLIYMYDKYYYYKCLWIIRYCLESIFCTEHDQENAGAYLLL